MNPKRMIGCEDLKLYIVDVKAKFLNGEEGGALHVI